MDGAALRSPHQSVETEATAIDRARLGLVLRHRRAARLAGAGAGACSKRDESSNAKNSNAIWPHGANPVSKS
jgi:hypothetical protein